MIIQGNVGIGTTGPADILHLTTGNLRIGASTAVRATTAGTNQLILFDGTAPVGTLVNGISMYSTAGEAYIMDAAGNATLQSPHENENNYWVFDSKNSYTGKSLLVDMELMMKQLNAVFGWDFVHETIDGVTSTSPILIANRIDLKIEGLEARVALLEEGAGIAGVNTESTSALGWIVAQFSDIYGVIWEHGLMKIAHVITDKLTTKEVQTEKLCVEEVCINKDQLKELLEKNNVEGSTGGGGNGDSGEENQEIIPDPITEETPDTEEAEESTPQPTPEATAGEAEEVTPESTEENSETGDEGSAADPEQPADTGAAETPPTE